MTDKETGKAIAIKYIIAPIIVAIVGGGLLYLFQRCIDDKGACNPFPDAPTPTVSFNLPNGELVFSTDRDGDYEIYLMNIEGTRVTRLTDNPGDDMYPAWSPDGNQISFMSDRDGDFEIYIMNADGSNVRQITFNDAYDCCAHWSPDGFRLTYNSNLTNGNQDIYVVGTDGSNPINLTNFPGDDQRPFWSPDGSKIAFEAMRDGQADIYVMNADGTNPTRLTQLYSQQKSGIAWHPNGSMIAYESNQRFDNGDEEGDINLYIMFANGTGQVPITDEPSDEKNPDWSKDGQYIVFTSTRDGNFEIYLMEWNGKRVMRLTDTPFNETGPAWRP